MSLNNTKLNQTISQPNISSFTVQQDAFTQALGHSATCQFAVPSQAMVITSYIYFKVTGDRVVITGASLT